MAYIKGISYYLPERIITNDALLEEFPEWSVDKVAKKVGVYSRHIAADVPEPVGMKVQQLHWMTENRQYVCLLMCDKSNKSLL